MELKVTYFLPMAYAPQGECLKGHTAPEASVFLTEEHRKKVHCTTCSRIRKQGFKPSAYNHIIGSRERKVNWTNFIFMCKPFAEVLRLPVSLYQIPIFHSRVCVFHRKQDPNSVQCQFEYWISCQNKH